jgi:hypothetical protein
MAVPTVCEKRWAEILASFERQHEDFLASHTDCKKDLGLIHAALITIRQLLHASPCNNENGTAWKDLVIKADAERAVLCKHLSGKALFTGMLHMYATTHNEMNKTLQPEVADFPTEFREQKRRKRNPSDKRASLPNNTEVKSASVRDPQPHAELPTRNFFAPLRAEMELESSKEETKGGGVQKEGTNPAGRPPPIILTSAVNLIQLQKELKGIVKGSFEF